MNLQGEKYITRKQVKYEKEIRVMMKVIERETGVELRAEAIDGGYQIYTQAGEKYKKLRESTFKRYYKIVEKESAEPVSDEKREKMIEKIKKMLALAENNPSEEESLAAALQAHKLMVKYNIHEDDVSLEEVKDDIVSIFSEQKHNSNLHNWRKQLGLVVANAFRCKCYIHGKDIVFRGYKEDAQLALEVYLMLYNVGDALGSKAYGKQLEETGSGKGAYNSVALGFLHGVKVAFEEQCTALMAVTPKEVEEDWSSFSANFKQSRSASVYSVNGDLYKQGFEEGKKAVKGRSIEKKGGNR
jgi:hypothetical protein